MKGLRKSMSREGVQKGKRGALFLAGDRSITLLISGNYCQPQAGHFLPTSNW